VFLAALGRPATEREAFLADSCGSDPALLEEVKSLLAFHSEQQSGDGAADESGPPTPGRSPFRDPFAPGDVFAGRYRMITRIGRGGMGDVWRADDLVLETPVALKLIKSSGDDARLRILNEVRLARQITDPAVCRVFDVGEADGQVFFSMELVRGEDLATLLRRVGRLPSERVIEIGQQLCAGLAAAHAQGVLHRDLKPANILIDDRGRVLITDFGIAVSREEPQRHALTGTPGYMAPEQLVHGSPLTERTDIYALGLVLYEILVGQHPFRADTKSQPIRPSTRVADVDPRLERVIFQALSTNPDERPQSAVAMASSLTAVTTARSRRRNWPWLAGAALLFGLLAVGASFVLQPRGTALSEQDTIVLADFANTTGEPVFDGTLKVALAVAMEQSPFLKVFPDDRIRETLRLMDRSPDERVTRQIGREIAQREQLKALLSGSISTLGRNYVLALEALNAATGDVMAREQVEVASKEEVLTALGKSAARLREKLGESLASVQKFDVPLARATTSSLEALHAYSLALDQGTANPRVESIPHLKRAIELDPDFALALAFMATVYSNTSQITLAPEYARRAFELRDRVSERERFFIAFRYYRDATQDWAQALELSKLWVATYPREAFAFNSYGSALARFGQYEQSLEPFREAIRLDPKFVAPYSNLITELIALNRFGEAKTVLDDAAGKKMDFAAARRLSYVLALIANDRATMERNAEASASVRDATTFGWRGHTAAFEGRAEDAHALFRRGIQMAIDGQLNEVAGQMSAEDAEVHAIFGECAETRAEVSAGMALSKDNFTLERLLRALSLCGAQAEANTINREILARFPDATLTTRINLPIAAAAMALSRNEPGRTVELLEPVSLYERTLRAELWPNYLRGLAYLQLKDGASAATQFQAVLDHRGEDPDSQFHALARLGLARAARLRGDVAGARQSYDAFFAAWKEGDPTVPAMKEARQEYAQLR